MPEEVYREMIRRAAHDADWASYVLLMELCKRVLAGGPADMEQLNSVSQQELLTETLVAIMAALVRVVPFQELIYYVPKEKAPPYPFVL